MNTTDFKWEKSDLFLIQLILIYEESADIFSRALLNLILDY